MNGKKARLIKYAESLKQRLSTLNLEESQHRPEAYKEILSYKQMLEIDLRKTLARIEKL